MRRIRAIGAWMRWEFSRRIEVTGFIKFIIAERFVKGGALLIGGFLLVFLSRTGVVGDWAQHVQEQLLLTPGRGIFHRMWTTVLIKFGHLSIGEQQVIGVAAGLYGALEVTEGVGLILRRRWAEYLVLIATVVFVPFELNEVIHGPSVLKVVALVVNVGIAVYLVVRKRLFIERPDAQIDSEHSLAPEAG